MLKCRIWKLAILVGFWHWRTACSEACCLPSGVNRSRLWREKSVCLGGSISIFRNLLSGEKRAGRVWHWLWGEPARQGEGTVHFPHRPPFSDAHTEYSSSTPLQRISFQCNALAPSYQTLKTIFKKVMSLPS